MHLLATQPGTIDDGAAAVDLGQTPGDIVVLSAADSEIAGLAAARRIILACAPRYRIPEPVRAAHNAANHARRRYYETAS